MLPASTVKLNPGDFCFIPRDDGKFVPFVFLCTYRDKRSSFYGGIIDVSVSRASVEELPPTLAIKEYALVHISCFTENNTPIVGNLADRIGSEVLSAIKRSVHDFSVGATSRVWGHKTIVKYANTVA